MVQLSDDADHYVVADAVRIDVPDPNTLRLTDTPVRGGDLADLSGESVSPVLTEAIAAWQATGLAPAELARLAAVDVQIAELPGDYLGLASADGTTIWLDNNAAGHGWNVLKGKGQRAK